MTQMNGDTRLCHSKGTISNNQHCFQQKTVLLVSKSFDYVIGQENSSFDAIKVLKTNVSQS